MPPDAPDDPRPMPAMPSREKPWRVASSHDPVPVFVALAKPEALAEVWGAWMTDRLLACCLDGGTIAMAIAPDRHPVAYRFQCVQCGVRTAWFHVGKKGLVVVDRRHAPLDESPDVASLPRSLQILLMKRNGRAERAEAPAVAARRRRR